MKKPSTDLSRVLSHALRLDLGHYGLELDSGGGWVSGRSSRRCGAGRVGSRWELPTLRRPWRWPANSDTRSATPKPERIEGELRGCASTGCQPSRSRPQPLTRGTRWLVPHL